LTTTASTPANTPIISVRAISKTFTGKRVLSDFNLDVMPGEVHGLVGQNGSGKSTLIKILAGFHEPDPNPDASLTMLGRKVSLPLRAGESARLGLAFVHQDLGLIDDATVLENVRVRRYSVAPGWRIPWSRERRYVRRILEEFGLEIDPDARVSTLRQAEKAQIAILRAYDQLSAVEQGLLVLDEPTPYLPRDGVERVFQTVRDVAARKFGVLFVSHRLEEVFELTNMVTVLRDGKVVDCSPTASLDEQQLIRNILGFSLDQLYPEPHEARQDRMFSVAHVSGDSVDDVSFDIHKGEILGITGLLGMGWDRLPYVLFGAENATGGTLTLNSKTVKLKSFQPSDAIKLGIAFLPANRLIDGSLQTATVTENLTLANLGKYFIGGLLRVGQERRAVDQLLVGYDVRPPDPDRIFSTLSGGNQQKVLIAKWFETNPKVLLLHEPTQGVDVGARAAIFRRIRDAASQGAAVLLATSEYEDLPNLCDRVIVMRSGRVIAELHGASLTTERIVEQSFRVSARASQTVAG
jgi:ribose transport system ATP-binding protein